MGSPPWGELEGAYIIMSKEILFNIDARDQLKKVLTCWQMP